MGVSDAPYVQPQSFPSPVACILVVVAVFILPVFSAADTCLIDNCWEEYKAASNALKKMYIDGDSSKSHETFECTAMRTYARCIKTVSHGCLGKIRYHSVKKVVLNHMSMNNCSKEGPTYDINGQQTTPASRGICSFKGRKVHRHCGLFGDPHLKTFDDHFQTCSIRGTWPLIRNDHLTVQVTNDAVGKGGSATATSKLTIVIKANERCGPHRFIVYMAQTDYLPSSFEDGQTSFGPEKAVEIVEIEANRHIEMHIRYIDTKITLRQIGFFFTFSITMPDSVVTQNNKTVRRVADLQLCVDGCPQRQLFNYQEFLSQKFGKLKPQIARRRDFGGFAMKRVDAEVLCHEAGVVDFYFDSCVFDLMITGDRNFTLAASSAFKDAAGFHTNSGKSAGTRQTHFTQSEVTTSTAALTLTSSTSVLCSLLILVSIWLNLVRR